MTVLVISMKVDEMRALATMALESPLLECAVLILMIEIKISLPEVGCGHTLEDLMGEDALIRETIGGEIVSIDIFIKTRMLKKKWWYEEGLHHLLQLHHHLFHVLLHHGPQGCTLGAAV